MEDLKQFCAQIVASSPGAETFIRGFVSKVVERWLWDLDNLSQFCVATLPPGRGQACANFVLHAAEKDVRFASARQTTSLGPLNFYWELPQYVPPNVLPGLVDYDRLPKDLRNRIESVLRLVSDLPVPIADTNAFAYVRQDDPWDKDLPPSFYQWRARLCFIGDSL